MRGGGRRRIAALEVALLLAFFGYASMAPQASAAPLTSAAPSTLAGSLPCPNIVRSSPATASTNPPPVPLSPCPGVVAGTFLGGSNADVATDVAVDAAGNGYATGWTLSPDFPTTPGAYDTTFNGEPEPLNSDAFLAKFDATGALVFSSFLGGSSRDHALAIAVDQQGNIYVTGSTASLDFPTLKGAYDTTFNGAVDVLNTDAFLAKFNSDGALVYSTFLGGSEADVGTSIALDAYGNAYVTGDTGSNDFPVTPGAFAGAGSKPDAFVAKLSPDGTALVYSTVIGGGGSEEASGIALDPSGNAYVAGLTHSPDFPVTPDAFDTTFNQPWPEEWGACCPYDAFLFKLTPDATALGYSTFIGGDATFLGGDICNEQITRIAANSSGVVYLAGYRGCLGQEDPPDPSLPPRDPQGFLARFEPSGMPIYRPFLFDADPWGVALDGSDNVYLTGSAGEGRYGGLPTTPGAYDRTLNGELDAFAAKLDAQVSTLLYSTYLGGGDEVLLEQPRPGLGVPSEDFGASIAFDPTGNATVVGWTGSIDFPVTEGGYDTAYNGLTDAFVIRIELIPEPNRAPYAYFEVVAPAQGEFTVFVNASNSADAEDADDLLEVRWDWEDDGVWDTAWSAVKTASHQYEAQGVYTIRLEVQDTGGLVGSTAREVTVRSGGAVEIAWIREFRASGHEHAEGVAVDAEGSAYVVGSRPGLVTTPLTDCIRLSGGPGGGGFLRKYNADGQELWTQWLPRVLAVAVDSTGVYVTGPTGGNFPGFENAGCLDVYVRKYDLDGNVAWTRQFGGLHDEATFGVDVDATGVYVAGGTYGRLGTIPGAEGIGDEDAFVTKLDLDGHLVWTHQFGTSSKERAEDVAVDSSGVYTTGSGLVRKLNPGGTEVWTHSFPASGRGIAADATGAFVAGDTLGAFPGQSSAGGLDAFIQKYDTNGNVLWTRQFGTSDDDTALGVAVDGTRVFATGSTAGAFPNQQNTGHVDAFIRHYGVDGEEGSTVQFGTSESDGGLDVDVGAFGVFAAGYTFGIFSDQMSGGAFLRRSSAEGNEIWRLQFGSDAWTRVLDVATALSGVFVVGWAGGALPGQTIEGAFVRKYDVDGNEVWTRQFGGDASGIAADPSGVYVTGGNAFVRKYDLDGNEVWTRQFGHQMFTAASAIATDPSGVYVAGSSSVPLSGQPAVGNIDAFVRKYDIDGNEIWTREFGSEEEDAAFAIAAGTYGVYVAGWTWGTLPGQTDPTGQGTGSPFVRKYDANGNEIWTRQFGAASYPGGAFAVGATSFGVVVGGFTWDALTGQVNFGYTDAFVRMYDIEGNEIWTRQFGSSNHDSVQAIAVGASGVYVAGEGDAHVRKYDVDGNEIWTYQFAGTAIATDPSGVYVGGAARLVKLAESETANAPPAITGINSSPAAALPGQEVALTATAYDADGDALTYAWSFGDGVGATGTTAVGGGSISATHAYGAAGLYTVTLSVDDVRGGTATKSVTVRVVAPLSLDVSAEPITGTVPLTVSFAASPADGTPPYSFEWDFGDGSSSTTQNPTHTYPVAGTYTVTLNIADADGRTATKTIQITASAPGPTVTGTGTPQWVLYTLGAAVAVGIGGLLFWRWRGRTRTPPPPPGSV